MFTKHSKQTGQAETTTQPAPPDQYGNPDHPEFIADLELREAVRRQVADPAAELRREMRAERAAGQGSVLGSIAIKPEPPLSTATTRIVVLNLDNAADRRHFIFELRKQDARQALADAQAKLILAPGRDAIRPPACRICDSIMGVQSIKVADGEQFSLCPDCGSVAVADAVQRRAGEVIRSKGMSRRDAIHELRRNHRKGEES